MNAVDPQRVFDTVDLFGVVANAFLGGAIARSLKLDIVGFVVLAIMSGLGGGMIRDVLLQQGFPVALTNPAYLSTAMIGATVAFFWRMDGKWTGRIINVMDSLSLGCWAATGTSKALAAGLGWMPSIMLGLVTAVGGGTVRDMAVGRLPRIFGGNTLYASGGLVGALAMCILWELRHPNWGMAAAIVLASVITLIAQWRGWQLPGPKHLVIRLPKGADLFGKATRADGVKPRLGPILRRRASDSTSVQHARGEGARPATQSIPRLHPTTGSVPQVGTATGQQPQLHPSTGVMPRGGGPDRPAPGQDDAEVHRPATAAERRALAKRRGHHGGKNRQHDGR